MPKDRKKRFWFGLANLAGGGDADRDGRAWIRRRPDKAVPESKGKEASAPTRKALDRWLSTHSVPKSTLSQPRGCAAPSTHGEDSKTIPAATSTKRSMNRWRSNRSLLTSSLIRSKMSPEPSRRRKESKVGTSMQWSVPPFSDRPSRHGMMLSDDRIAWKILPPSSQAREEKDPHRDSGARTQSFEEQHSSSEISSPNEEGPQQNVQRAPNEPNLRYAGPSRHQEPSSSDGDTSDESSEDTSSWDDSVDGHEYRL